MPLLPSESPTPRSPSPDRAPHRSPLGRPASLPIGSDNGLTGSHAHSIHGRLACDLRAPLLSLRVSFPPALRTTGVCTDFPDMPLPSHSSCPVAMCALPTAESQVAAPGSAERSPMPGPRSLVPVACNRIYVPGTAAAQQEPSIPKTAQNLPLTRLADSWCAHCFREIQFPRGNERFPSRRLVSHPLNCGDN